MVCAALAAVFLISRYNDDLFWVSLAVVSAVSLVFLYFLTSYRRQVRRMTDDAEGRKDLSDTYSLYKVFAKMPMPALFLDGDWQIDFHNKPFKDLMNGEVLVGHSLDELIDIDMSELRSKRKTDVKINGREYIVHVLVTEIDSAEDSDLLRTVYFEDVTELNSAKQDYLDNCPRVMMIMVDSLEETLANSRDSDRGHITMQIDRLIENFIESCNGVTRKTSPDRFFAVISDAQLEKLRKQEFKSLTDEARKIMYSVNTPVTLSIGIGVSDESVGASEKLAKQALDMTQVRGGDQVAIYDGKDYDFFGGTSGGIGKNSKVKVRVFATGLENYASECDSIVIMGHENSDLDAVGAAAGLAGALRAIGKNAYVYCNRASTLANPLIERIEEKLFDSGNSIFIDEKTALSMLKGNGLLIIVDTSNRTKVDSKLLYESAQKLIYIDHHRQVAKQELERAYIYLHDTVASSACELVTEVIQCFDFQEPISPFYAEALMAGILLDTKDFVVKTGVRTFEAAAYLKRVGADTVAVKLMFSNTIESEKLRSKIINTMHITERCAISAIDAQSSYIRIAAAQAADDMLNIQGVDASFVLYTTQGGVGISARSYGALNVQLILENFKGGGHLTMAGAFVAGGKLSDVCKQLEKRIQETVHALNTQARDNADDVDEPNEYRDLVFEDISTYMNNLPDKTETAPENEEKNVIPLKK